MRSWNIEWTQRWCGETRHFTEEYMADTAAAALAEWWRKAYCNARVEAVYDPTAIRAERVTNRQ